MITNKNSQTAGQRTIRAARKLLLASAALFAGVLVNAPTSALAADKCLTTGTYNCTNLSMPVSYNPNVGGFCLGPVQTRTVRYQIPANAAKPIPGWPVAFYYHGTISATGKYVNPFSAVDNLDGFGFSILRQAFHEMLDSTGTAYAVIAPEAPNNFGTEFWDTNGVVQPYNYTNDSCFLPALFKAVANNTFAGVPAGTSFDKGRFYAFGMSSGGFNTSRMAVSFNPIPVTGAPVWKALGIISGSYATCAGGLTICPSMPAVMPVNHPKTKFWYGSADTTVYPSIVTPYWQKLGANPLYIVNHPSGHTFTTHDLGASGVKAWFDANP